MRKCQKEECENIIPYSVWIDGKQRYLHNRKYCLECSPFGKHNTRNLDHEKLGPNETHIEPRICSCGNTYENKGTKCWSCCTKKSRTNKRVKLVSLLGNNCWMCGYDKCVEALEFHHVDPSKKSFGLSVRECQYSWEKIFEEVKKCVLLCANCHREFHSNMIDASIEDLHKIKWDDIILSENTLQAEQELV